MAHPNWELVSPPIYTESNSFTMRQWLQRLWIWTESVSAIVTLTTDYTVPANVHYVRGDGTAGAITITLPPAIYNTGRRILIKKIDAGTGAGHKVTVACSGSDTIEGSATVALNSQWNYVRAISNGIDGWEQV